MPMYRNSRGGHPVARARAQLDRDDLEIKLRHGGKKQDAKIAKGIAFFSRLRKLIMCHPPQMFEDGGYIASFLCGRAC